jgi:hypothetical protein
MKIRRYHIGLTLLMLHLGVALSFGKLEQWRATSEFGSYKITGDEMTKIESIPPEIIARAISAIIYRNAPSSGDYYVDDISDIFDSSMGGYSPKCFFISKERPIAKYIRGTSLGYPSSNPNPKVIIYYEFSNGVVQKVEVKFIPEGPDLEGPMIRDTPSYRRNHNSYHYIVMNNVDNNFDPSQPGPAPFPSPSPRPVVKRAKPLHIHAMIIST